MGSVDPLLAWFFLAAWLPLKGLRWALERDVGRASATNNGQRQVTDLTVDNGHWSVPLTREDVAEARRLARREVGLEHCEWRREVVGWTPGRRLSVASTTPIMITSHDHRGRLYGEDGEPISKPIYGMVEHWVPAD